MQRFLFLSLKSLSHNCCWGVLEFMKDEKSFSKAFSSCIFPHQHSTYQAKSFSKYIIHKKLYFFLKQKRRKINKKGFVWSSHFHNFLFLVKFYVACVFLFVFIYWIFDVKRNKTTFNINHHERRENQSYTLILILPVGKALECFFCKTC